MIVDTKKEAEKSGNRRRANLITYYTESFLYWNAFLILVCNATSYWVRIALVLRIVGQRGDELVRVL